MEEKSDAELQGVLNSASTGLVSRDAKPANQSGESLYELHALRPD